ncbi:MAG: hypothetical protein NTV89_00260 [Proteobacteria bacterium]|nr:hypothetical protein [Pseudomonadota bacterium]
MFNKDEFFNSLLRNKEKFTKYSRENMKHKINGTANKSLKTDVAILPPRCLAQSLCCRSTHAPQVGHWA